MTAEEIFDKVMSEYDTSRTYTVDWVTEAMKQYAKERCKEQRSICSDKFDMYSDSEIVIQNKILTAPEPEML